MGLSMMPANRLIAHFDLDCFFVAVERLKNPRLVGMPVMVAGDPGTRTVVSSASYEARRCGVRAGMPVSVARRLCPEVIRVRGDFASYDDYHFRVLAVVKTFSPQVEIASIDEGYLEWSPINDQLVEPLETASRLKCAIKAETGLDCSIGVASNRMISKIATNYVKPNGIMWIPPGRERQFIWPLAVEELPGIGPKIRAQLNAMGIVSVADLAGLHPVAMRALFGAKAVYFARAAQGIGEGIRSSKTSRQSIGREMTFPKDITNQIQLQAVLYHLVEGVCDELQKECKRAGEVRIKLRFADFTTRVRSCSFKEPTVDPMIMFEKSRQLLLANCHGKGAVRMMGFALSRFSPDNHQVTLFQSLPNKIPGDNSGLCLCP